MISVPDLQTIYQVPSWLQSQKVDELVVSNLGFSDTLEADVSDWNKVVYGLLNPKFELSVAMVGKYTDVSDAYKSLIEALQHAGIPLLTRVNVISVSSELLERGDKDAFEKLKQADAILIPGGFGSRGFEGKVLAARYAREEKVPFLGICYGMHVAIVEMVRNQLGLSSAHTVEVDPTTPHPVIHLVKEWEEQDGQKQYRNARDDRGGSMRLGQQVCILKEGTQVHRIYGSESILERHRHRYEVNEIYVKKLEEHGLIASGLSSDGALIEVIELADHPWFISGQFHPEFTSSPRTSHPLFLDYVGMALELKLKKL